MVESGKSSQERMALRYLVCGDVMNKLLLQAQQHIALFRLSIAPECLTFAVVRIRDNVREATALYRDVIVRDNIRLDELHARFALDTANTCARDLAKLDFVGGVSGILLDLDVFIKDFNAYFKSHYSFR